MHFPTSLLLLSAAPMALALPMAHQARHVHMAHKRGNNVVTSWVEAQVTVVQSELVYVDQKGSTVSVVTNTYTQDDKASESSAPETASSSAAATTSTSVEEQTTLVNLSTELAKGYAKASSTKSSAEPTSTEEATTSAYEAPSSTSYEEATTSSYEQQTTLSSTWVEATTSEAATTAPSSTYEEPTSSASESSSAPSSSSSSGSSTGTVYTGDGTYYTPGLGSCGVDSTESDYIVAISHSLYDSISSPNPNNNPFCGRKIKAWRDGKDASSGIEVTVVDRCTGCKVDDLDFSPTAFDQLGDQDEGRITIQWEFLS